ncbi:MAG TPA: fibronectin type III domain-containing protein [Pyrinomonadaceae bacterium]|jgi:hypothetical protein
MAKIKLNFRKLSVMEKIARARQIVAAMTDNPAFPTPTPTLAAVSVAINAVEQANAAALEARALSKQRTSELEDVENELITEVTRLAGYVESASGGRDDVILSAAMDVRAPSVVSNAPPSAPISATATTGDRDGEIDLSWNAVQGAQSYIVQVSPNPPTDTSWTQAAVVTASRCTISNLTSGSKYWFRVSAVGAGGQSGWSDPTTKMAP